ncbi:hypothetical protein AQUCO_02800117v1 [Aquilegia coerulea]|uniref:Glycosyltransferase n=1 Tax=Aquilegia coerulea TaxID=218851 RepID=A0A2G5D3Y1_AQUCA|nr:hypothetical protein AQUCO_02800117v1 [Aquilegia coerulea]
MVASPLATTNNKPHAVCIPYPAQGHINPLLKIAKLLHNKGFHITFVHTEYNYKRMLKSRGPDSLKGLPDFQFKSIPDGLPPSDVAEITQDLAALCDSIDKNCLVPFRDLVNELNNNCNVPPVTCIVADGVMSFTLDVAHEFCIPEVLFWTTSACGFMGYIQIPQLIKDGLLPLKDLSNVTNGYLEKTINWVPGIENIRLKDVPSFFIQTTDPNDIMFKYNVKQVERASKASAIVVNTFDELEHDVLESLKSKLPPIYPIGFLHLLVNRISHNGLDSIESNLWKEDLDCLKWLDSKEENSVVYVNFGSITVMTPQQMTEFAWGLANSKQTFFWIIRPDLVSGDFAVLPPEFIMEIKERGLLASWCPQEQVLNHPSIGGFLTHSGWNSTIESISSGVPMICWPFCGEQQMNCTYSCLHWGIGMEIDNNVKREVVESIVSELMEGKKGKEMKVKAIEWKRKAKEAVAPGGSSYQNIDKFIKEILL